MWAKLALSTVLTVALTVAPAQGAGLALKNARPTYGALGEDRKDSKVLPGDIYWVSFDITGLKVDEDSGVKYSMYVEFADKSGTQLFKGRPQPNEARNTLGGDSLPAYANVKVGLDTKPGDYTLTIHVTDELAKKSEELKHKFQVLEPSLGIVQVGLNLYESPNLVLPAPPTGTRGQNYFLKFAIVGFKVDEKKKDPKEDAVALDFEMKILDTATGKPTIKPWSGSVTRIVKGFQILPYTVPIELNRAGKFQIVLKVTDKLAKNASSDLTLSLSVLDLK